MTQNPGDTPSEPPPPPYGQQPPAYGTPPSYSQPPAQGEYGQPPAQGGYGQPPAQGGYGRPPAHQGPGVSPGEERTWAMLAHLGGLLFGFIPSLIVYLVYKDRSRFLRSQSAEALNFQITLFIGYVIAGVLSAILIGLLFFPILWIIGLVFCIIAGIAANKGQDYRYPFNLRLVS